MTFTDLAVDTSQKLIAHIREHINAQGGVIPFNDYMHQVLYTPGLGYYAAGNYKLGAQGDFTTAPERSALFGRTLAHFFATEMALLTDPILLECGPGSGKLAVDIIDQLKLQNALPVEYWILEASPDLIQRQQDLLQQRHADFFDRIRWLDQPPTQPFNGIVFGNEVLDALPVSVIKKEANNIIELGVSWTGKRFDWQPLPQPTPAVEKALTTVQQYVTAWPEGYTTELSTSVNHFLSDVCTQLQTGKVLWLDYGYDSLSYYNPTRTQGSLRCYYQQQQHNDVFAYPGLQDITAHVNFEQVAECMQQLGFNIESYNTQAEFLLESGIDVIYQQLTTSVEALDVDLSTQLRFLLQPELMGEQIKVLLASPKT